MKYINVTSYDAKDIFKLVRTNIGLTQGEISSEMGRVKRTWANYIENGKSRYTFKDFLTICKRHDIEVIFRYGTNEIKCMDYEPKEIFRFIRQWTELSQKELSKEMNKYEFSWAKEIESGKNNFYFDDLCKICANHNIEILIGFDSKVKA